MCQHASFRVTRTRVLWSRKTANHSDINREYGISDRTDDPRDIEAVSVEIVPPDNDYRKPLAEWVFRVDQDILPDWWNAKEAEVACREVLPKYVKCHVLIGGTHIVSDGESHIYIDADVTVNGGEAVFYGDSAGTVNGGWAVFYGNSTGTVNGGKAVFYGDSAGTVNDGWAVFHGNSTGTVNGGKAVFHGNSERIDAK